MLNAGIMDMEEFEDMLKMNKICVCDFSATWCGPCRMMAPILEDLSEKYKGRYSFFQIDIDSAEDLAQKFNIEVVPTIVCFKDGKEIGRTTGYQEFDEIERFILKIAKS